MLKNSRGFTLIEMLIVIMIISVLIILIVPSLSGSSKEVHEKGCDALVTVLQTQVYLYNLENDEYPMNIQTLVDEGYITAEQTKCSNGIELDYNDETGLVSKKTNSN